MTGTSNRTVRSIRSLIAATLIVVLSVPAFARAPVKGDSFGAAWRVSRDGASAVLFGTLHQFDRNISGLPADVQDLISDADTVVLEIASVGVLDIVGLQWRGFGRRANGVEGMLDANTRRYVYDIAREINGTAIGFGSVRPWYAYMIVMSYCTVGLAQLMDIDEILPPNSVDRMVHDFAEDAGRKIGEIERVGESMAPLVRLGPDLFVDLLTQLADEAQATGELCPGSEFGGVRADIQRMEDAYFSRDTDLLEYFVTDPEIDPYGILRALLVERNAVWLPRIIDRIESEPTFFAFGIGHMLGPDSLLVMLADEGFAIERLF